MNAYTDYVALQLHDARVREATSRALAARELPRRGPGSRGRPAARLRRLAAPVRRLAAAGNR